MTTALSPQGRCIIDDAPSPAYLAAMAIPWLASGHWDQTRWPAPAGENIEPVTGVPRRHFEYCIGGRIALAAGFRRGSDEHHTHTGDAWWVVLEALMGDIELPSGLSLFAPEATADEIAPALYRIVDNNHDREAVAA